MRSWPAAAEAIAMTIGEVPKMSAAFDAVVRARPPTKHS
jgi:hypothetical protein